VCLFAGESVAPSQDIPGYSDHQLSYFAKRVQNQVTKHIAKRNGKDERISETKGNRSFAFFLFRHQKRTKTTSRKPDPRRTDLCRPVHQNNCDMSQSLCETLLTFRYNYLRTSLRLRRIEPRFWTSTAIHGRLIRSATKHSYYQRTAFTCCCMPGRSRSIVE
jgi:hypothetical protein